MSSNMLTGERRWASARRGGMTVLGKVAVPKPLNLPSQRLENHGLDPNVEIVPKGTLSWGIRPSSSGSNPWISSSISPSADGGTVSPSHLSGRPSSGGSGTRPSTAGSDRTHEPVASAWGSNSRPSSASGTLSSNQTSLASLRPRSAENRPNSSQLSRFADNVFKNSAAWGPSSTAERLGVSPKEDAFSLSSGDFPSLGSDKENSVKNIESEERGRPSSASGRIAQEKEDAKSQADVKRGTVNTWRADGPHSAEEDMRPSMEKWQGDPHQYFSVNTGPQRFDPWHGPPMNGPAGPWYGGRPRGPPFGPPVPPGGFPVEPFPYYRPQIPPPPLAGSQPGPPPGPRGPHPKNGDLYRPQMPDAYARPGMPFRPGFYPGPPGPMAFDSYYGPPMGYRNNERDIPYMGMPAGPPVYNGYPHPAPDNSPGRAAGRGPAGKTFSEQVEPEHLEDAQGPKRVHLYNHEYQREEGENQEHKVQSNVSYPGKTSLPMISNRKNEWGDEDVAEEAIDAKRKTPSGSSSRSHEYRVHATDKVKIKSFGGTHNIKAVDDNWINKSENVPSLPPEMPQIPPASERDSSIPAAKNNSALMHKIDGLNAKVRFSVGRNDSSSTYSREEERKGSQIPDMKINNYTSEVGNAAGSFERIPVSRDFVSVPHEVIVPVADKPMALLSRRSYHGEQGRVDHRVKGKFKSQDVDGWRRKPLSTESSSEVMASNIEPAPNTHAHGPAIVREAFENSIISRAEKLEGDSVEACDSTDIQAQRAKMRELAKQRALQLQKEEEERTKEQKAKALAKLEELNRRSVSGEAANQKAERTQAIGNIGGEQEESRTASESVIVDLKFQEPGWNLVPDPDIAAVDRGNSADQAGESVEVSRNLPSEIQQAGLLESKVSPLPMDGVSHDGSTKKVTVQSNDGVTSRHKRTGYKQKQNNLLQKSVNEISVSNVASGTQKDHPHTETTDVTSQEGPSIETKLSESNAYNTSSTVVEPHPHQKRKNNRGSKNKHKLDETSAVPALLPVVLDFTPGNEPIEHSEPKDSSSNLDCSVSAVIEPDSGVQAQDTCSSLPNEESHNRGSNQWRPNPSRRLQKGQQANRFIDKPHGSDTVVWAPVRQQNKAKDSVEASQSTQESANSTKDNNMAQNSLKGKRAEMERYVPKAVAKELSQQGSAQPLASSISSSRSNEGGAGSEQSVSASSTVAQPATSATVNVESSVGTNEWDDNRNKHKKDQGSWKQRASSDSSHMKGVHVRHSPTSESTKDIEQSKELFQSVKSEANPANTEPKASGIVNKYPAVKDQGATVRGKRHQPRGPRSTGNNLDSNSTYSGESDGNFIQSAGPDANQSDRNIASKENHSFGERTSSHWQPKSNSNYANNQHGNRNTGSESVTTESNRFPKKDHAQHKVQAQRRHDKEGVNVGQSQPGQHANVQSNVGEETSLGNRQQFDREKKPNPEKGRPFSPNQDTDGWNENTPAANTDDQLEHAIPSGSRRNARQNNRPIRGGYESRGDWSSGYDNRPHNTPAFRDRQRQNVHMEYQPVGPFRGNKPEKVYAPADGAADSADRRHRERGQTHPKRGGNSHRRQSGTVNDDSGWN